MLKQIYGAELVIYV